MIKANELRIGIRINEGMVVGITPSEIITIDGKHWDVVDIEPIPLTPEILEKCGFKRKEKSSDIGPTPEDTYRAQGMPIFNYYYWNLDGFSLSDDFYHGTVKVTCLHQLQNLYFALTGKELTISLKNSHRLDL